MLSDTGKAVAIAYGVVETAEAPRSPRTSFLIGPDGRIARVYAPVVAAEHPDQVLADLG